MPLSEFQLIERYFAHAGSDREDVALGVGDDCALLRTPDDRLLAVSTDTLVEGVHFLAGADPEALGHKALAVNLSDLAAMGAEPAWVTLALTLPKADAEWLAAFARGFSALARHYGVQLVGGDTTRGPLSITVQVHGFVEEEEALTRAGAQVGDLIYVTGTLGDAGLALLALRGAVRVATSARESLLDRLNRPRPRVEAGRALRGLASSCIDISDGLAADLGHILEASGVGGIVYLAQLPISALLSDALPRVGGWSLPLAAGDDYELCFTVPPARQAQVESALAATGCPCRWIGMVEARKGLRCLDPDGSVNEPGPMGWDHFRT